MKSYPSYISPHVNWLDDVPSHWNIKMIKHVFHPRDEKTEDGNEELLSVLIRKGVVKRRAFLDDESEHLTRSKSLIGYRLCSKGNLVNNIMKMGFYCLGISDYEGIVSPAYSVFEIIDEDDIPRYWEYLLKTELYVSEYRKKSKGIQASRMRLYDDYFLPIHTLYPPKDEQHQIVSFLDSKTQKIDKLIEITEQKIELLKEQRTALINQCVTKGLNPNVEMKDSGVEWIGEIPKDWDISKFKYISEIVTGNTPPKANEELHYTDSKKGFLWVKPTSLNKGLNYVNESVEHLTEEGKLATRVIPKDSTMICCIGNTIGKHSISGQELSTNQQINSVIPNQTRLHPYFCLLYANVFTRDLLKWANYVTLPIFTKSDLEDTSFLLPPLEEQTAIVETIRSENRLFDSTIEKESQRIELLKEYRQALISEVVTGKIDVRGL